MSKALPETAKISVKGVVQGVGFRPFVYQLAGKYRLNGWVCNTSEDVRIEVEGERKKLNRFIFDLQRQAPPMSVIESIDVTFLPPCGCVGFKILESIKEDDKYQLISPDIATCDPCKSELFNTGDRRYRYPFTNCTNCGPRFTIIEDIPYDRPLTTMRDFTMCPECRNEYEDPSNRRFHAQPNACPKCGPSLTLLNASGKPVKTGDAIKSTVEYLKAGKIVAVKGLGGFLLACNAADNNAVHLLRSRKHRPHKPLAIMVKDIREALRYCTISPMEKTLLQSPQAPIVLLQKRKRPAVSRSVAPDNNYLGIMLPYTPLHHILMSESGIPLVMTSGNLTEEPIVGKNEEALQRLAGVADFFLIHNRDIFSTYDDSITRIESDRIEILRRARGFAPYPVQLPVTSRQILACGADEKNTFCLTRDRHAFVSQHIGDMENIETMEHYKETVELYKRLYRIEPELIAYDMHPEYLTHKYAREQAAAHRNYQPLAIQHHHAHIAGCMADNGYELPVIGIALDGTGYGTDGNIWGGEFMVADYHTFARKGHLEYLPLPGGTAAIKQPYRTAIGYLQKLLGSGVFDSDADLLKTVKNEEKAFIRQQVQSGFNCPLTSSMGRLFDAISALLGIRDTISFEAQAAIALETAAYAGIEAASGRCYRYTVEEVNGIFQIRLHDLFKDIVSDLKQRITSNIIAAKFHNTIADIINETCRLIREKTSIETVALSGGVFQNRLLLTKTKSKLASSGFIVLSHHQVPCNDGGISLGQAVIASYYKR
jgi:hydrogenase maturation protein HypF